MNIKKIKELVDLMNENELTELEIEQEGMKIKLTKKGQAGIEKVITAIAAEESPVSAAKPAEKLQPEQTRGRAVKTPMVGTFYRAPAPDEAPYVKVGDIVQKEDVLCIVEAMKLMNEIKAEFGGRIAEILVEDGAPVEFGQALFLIEEN